MAGAIGFGPHAESASAGLAIIRTAPASKTLFNMFLKLPWM
jgi:hypothetical protein